MKTSKLPSPARSEGANLTPKRQLTRSTRSVCSPARSNVSGRLTSIIEDNQYSFAYSPLINRKSVLNDNTNIEEPRRASWWKKLNENSRDVIEVMNAHEELDANNVIEEYVDILSQEKQHHTLDLPDSSDNESINSIVIPQRKLFNQKVVQQEKNFKEICGNRETLAKINKTNNDLHDKSVKVTTKNLFGHHTKRSRPVFPEALLNISLNKTTANQTMAPTEVKGQAKTLFGNRPGVKRKNMFIDFIVSESEDEIPEIEPKIFAFPKKPKSFRRVSSSSRASSITTDVEMDDWNMLPSSTMVDHQLENIDNEEINLHYEEDPDENDEPTLKEKQNEVLNISHKAKSEPKQKEKSAHLFEDIVDRSTRSMNKSNNKHNFNKSTEQKEKNKNKSNLDVISDGKFDEIREEIGSEKSQTYVENQTEGINRSLKQDNHHLEQKEQIPLDMVGDLNNSKKINKSNSRIVDNQLDLVQEDIAKGNLSMQEEIEEQNDSVQNEIEEENDPVQENNSENEGQNESEVEGSEQNKTEKSKSRIEDDKLDSVQEEIEEENDSVQDENDSVQDENEEENDSVQEENDSVQVENDSVQEENDTVQEDDNNSEKEVQNESEEVEGSEQNKTEKSKSRIEDDKLDSVQEEIEEENDSVQDENEEENDSVQEENDSVQVENDSMQEENDSVQEENVSMQEEDNNSENEAQNESEEVEGSEQDSSLAVTEQSDNDDVAESDQEVINETDEQIETNDEDEQNQSDHNEDEENNENDQESGTDNHEQNESITNITHDTTGRNRNKSPEAVLQHNVDPGETFMNEGRNTSIRKTKSIIKNLNIKPSLAPVRESIDFSDGTRDSSAEGSGWDSHRTTRKTIRQTLGKDFSPRKSLRALVMEKTAKRFTTASVLNDDMTKLPQANSTELPDDDGYDVTDENIESEVPVHEISKRTRQATLEMYLQSIKQKNIQNRLQMEEEVINSIKNVDEAPSYFKKPMKPSFALHKAKSQKNPSKTKVVKSTIIPFEDLPENLLQDMIYKPPKRYRPGNAAWITKRLYNFLENELESKYDFKARRRAERLVENIYNFTKDTRRVPVASQHAIDVLKKEMATLQVVQTHFEFYNFFHEYMPREIRVKVVPDVVNKLPLPKNGVFTDIL